MVMNHLRTTMSTLPQKRIRKILSVSTDDLVELLSTESGNENVIQRYRDRAKERRNGIHPDYQNEYVDNQDVLQCHTNGLDYEKNRKEEQRERANEWDNILSSEYDETAEDRSKNTLLFGVHEGDDSRLKEKLTSKLERNTPESYAECCPGVSR
ncbi:hypothetical protein NPIL_563961 [Nephila pilipes]|uniref:Uncharacterized protein n=1 Tax=Nephila pilipes TaxID=299642 RepID=A0A8X6U103_NEPPI|nr:hypothetical protein NPIL_563961 [Nephila pilipes]